MSTPVECMERIIRRKLGYSDKDMTEQRVSVEKYKEMLREIEKEKPTEIEVP